MTPHHQHGPEHPGKVRMSLLEIANDKKEETKKMILNLEKFKTHIQYKHFKMESIEDVINVIRPGDYIASIDLKDAFFLGAYIQTTSKIPKVFSV